MARIFEQQFAEQAFDMLTAILDQSQECILLIDGNDQLPYINRAGRGHLGLADDAALSYPQWLNYWPEAVRADIQTAITQARGGQAGRVQGACSPPKEAERWCELEISPVHNRAGALSHVLVIARDVTPSVMRQLDEQRRREDAEREAVLSDSVAREMRHRFKNQLAVVGSLLRLSARNATSPAELATRMEQRLASLALAQDFLAIHRGDQMEAGDAIRQIVLASGAGERVELQELPENPLGADAIQCLALILGELQTNALKYGALATNDGGVTLSAREEDGRLAVRWREIGSQSVTPPAQQGGGLKLLDRMGSIGAAKASIEWLPNGVSITFYARLPR